MNELLTKFNFKFSKSLGQNFIFDSNLLEAICIDADIKKEDTVLEIGCGAGTLTKKLSVFSKKVIGFEIDKTLSEILEENLKECLNVKIIYDDFLKYPESEMKSLIKGKFKVVANLPYYITTPIIFNLIESDFNIESITIMVQREVGARICAKPGERDYGSLSVALQSFSDCKIVRTIKNTVFCPPPKVDSVLVKIDVNKEKLKITNLEHFKKLYRCAFLMRRKTFLNNIITAFGYSKEKVLKAFQTLNFSENVRGETLSGWEFCQLSNLFIDSK